MSDDPKDVEEVQRRLQEIQWRKRGRVRWNVSTHTAELALGAIELPPKLPRPNGKPRRRQRRKRLL